MNGIDPISGLVGAAGACIVPVFAIVAVIILIVAIVHGSKRERERTEALRAYAAQLGFAFTPSDPSLDARMSAFPPFCVGHSREGLNLASGEMRLGGIRMAMTFGDYRYKVTSSNGKQTTTTTYTMSFVAVQPALSVPEQLVVRAEGFFDKIGAFIGFDDIDFESSEFSKRFHVKCSDRRTAFDLFDPRMMEYFLAVAPPRIHAGGGVLLFDRGVRRWEVAEFAGEMRWIDGFFARVPRHMRAARLPEAEQASDPVLNPGSEPAGGQA